MACDYVFLESARSELEAIARHLSSTTGSMRASDAFLSTVQRSIDTVCEFPTIHAISRMPELAERGYRAAFVGSYVMLYLFEGDTAFIAHVFHQRQDYAHLV